MKAFWSLKWGGYDGEGNEHTHTIANDVESIGYQGFWAFAHNVAPNLPTVHIWALPDTPLDTLRHVLGHELGHIACDAYLPPFPDIYPQEDDADIPAPYQQPSTPENVPPIEHFVDLFGWVARQVDAWLFEVKNHHKQSDDWLPLSEYLSRYRGTLKDAEWACVIAQIKQLELDAHKAPSTDEDLPAVNHLEPSTDLADLVRQQIKHNPLIYDYEASQPVHPGVDEHNPFAMMDQNLSQGIPYPASNTPLDGLDAVQENNLPPSPKPPGSIAGDSDKDGGK